ncbi:cation/H(+) antiporter 15-like [Papaver somniferum]|uniref:cation/H(+) antiporter 15-like n=1 Tax=Papaver somniferum TaxID=3469 RepID=UPI000E70141D|nr:cation/H(+) antiporter 15-like [Papaver somniferum]
MREKFCAIVRLDTLQDGKKGKELPVEMGGMHFSDWGPLGYPFISNPGENGEPLGIQVFIFPENSMQVLDTLAHFSSTFFIFKVGVQMDPKMLKTSGLRTYVLGLGCFLCSFIFGDVLSHWLKNKDIEDLVAVNSKGGFRGSDRIIDLFSLVSFPVIAYVLTDLNILNSELGHLALHVAMVANFLHLVGKTLIFFQGLYASANPVRELYVVLVLVGLFIFIFFIVRPAALWIVKNTPEGKPVKESYISLIVASVLLCGLATEYCGFYVTDGAFILGLAIPDGPPLGTTIVDKLDYMFTTLLMPLHIGIVGLKTQFYHIGRHL